MEAENHNYKFYLDKKSTKGTSVLGNEMGKDREWLITIHYRIYNPSHNMSYILQRMQKAVITSVLPTVFVKAENCKSVSFLGTGQCQWLNLFYWDRLAKILY